MSKHPDRIPFFEYWIKNPVITVVDAIDEFLFRANVILTGKWYCEYCCDWHHRRDRKYYTSCISDAVPVCYKGVEALKNRGGHINE